MKRKIMAIILAIASISASATVINFDNLSNSAAVVSEDFSWSNFRIANQNVTIMSGYINGTVSPDNVAYNAFGEAASIKSNGSTDFTFNGTYLTGAWNDGLNVSIIGKRDGTNTFTTTVQVNTAAPIWFTFDWLVDELLFTSSGGVDSPLYPGGSGTHFAMDNFTYNEISQAVPEPGSLALLSLAVIGLGVAGRRKTKA